MNATINPARGETALCINGEPHGLCLTLGALAEIETALGGGDFNALKKRLENPCVGDLLVILHALLKGGGSSLTFEALKASHVDFSQAAAAIAGAFHALNGEEEPSAPGKPLPAAAASQAAASPRGRNGSPPEFSS